MNTAAFERDSLRDENTQLRSDVQLALFRAKQNAETVVSQQLEIRKLEAENVHMRWLLKNVLSDLPAKRDWLDPDLERRMREVLTP